MKPITDNELLNHQLDHRHGGNGFVVVQMLDDEYVKVAPIGRDVLVNQAFLAYRPMLSVGTRLKDPLDFKGPLVPDTLDGKLLDNRQT